MSKENFLREVDRVFESTNQDLLPEEQQRNRVMRDAIYAFANSPEDPKELKRHRLNRLLIAIEKFVIPKMPIEHKSRNHRDFADAMDQTFEYLYKPNSKTNDLNIFNLNLSSESRSLNDSLGKAIYNVKMQYKLRELSPADKSPEFIKPLRYQEKKLESLNKELKDFDEKLKGLEQGTEEYKLFTKNRQKIEIKISETKAALSKVKQLLNPKRISTPDPYTGEIENDPDSTATSTGIIETEEDKEAKKLDERILDHVRQDPNGILAAIQSTDGKSNCHTIWMLKLENKKNSDREIAERLEIYRANGTPNNDIIRDFWRRSCLPPLKEIAQKIQKEEG